MKPERRAVRTLITLIPGCFLLLPMMAPAQETPDAEPAAEGDVLREITVTATRQEQALSRVPISVSAFDQESMEQKGVKSFEDVVRFTPGVDFDPGSNDISIRGISSGAGAGTTGIYLDDTPIQMRGLGFSADNSLPGIFDLDRVEVLRGPQGTLFGAGSEGGTVRYITPQPSFTKYSSVARTEISSTQSGDLSYEAGGAIGGPIVQDKLGFRVSAWHRRDGGYIDRVDNATGDRVEKNANWGRTTVLRGALAFKPVDSLIITPSVLFQRRMNNASDTYFEAISDPGRGVFRNASPEARGDTDRFYLSALNIQYNLPAVSVISNTSYFRRNNLTGYDGTIYDLSYYQSLLLEGCDTCNEQFYPFLTETGINKDLPFYLSPSRVTNTQRNFTQEIRVQSGNPDARFNWVAGVFYQENRQRSTEELVDPIANDLFLPVFGMSIEDFFEWPLYGEDSYIANTIGTDKQTAVFLDLTYGITDTLKVTVGGRYARTKFSFENFADGSQNFGRTEAAGQSKESPFTPKVGLSWQINPENLLYLTYAEGFRVGGANPPIPFDACSESLNDLGITAAPDSYDSDSVKSWEIGTKNKLFDRHLLVAASVYRIKWQDIQQSVFLPSCAIQFTGNLGNAESTGFDLQFTFAPTARFAIDATVGKTDARYTSTTSTGPNRIVVNTGNGLGGAPWTGSLGIQQGFPAFGRDAYVRLDYEYSSRPDRLLPNQDPATRSYDPALVRTPATDFFSLRLGAMVNNINVALFADNLFDSSPRLSHTHSDSDTLLFTGTTFRPRTVGVTLTYRP
jgi:outer membrane receptor protein involved in Fe transport